MNKNIVFLLPFYEGRNHSQFLGIGYLSKMLLEHGYDTLIIDEDAVFTLMQHRGSKEPLKDSRAFIVDKLYDYSPGIICLTINTPNYERGLELLSLVRKQFREAKIIVGGPHITTSWKTFKKKHQSLFDIAVIGEGELTILEVCDQIFSNSPLNGIKGIVLSQSKDPVFNPRELIENLDSLPYPDRNGFLKPFTSNEFDILKEHYSNVFYTHLPGFKNKKYARIVGSRGCNYSCNFCSPSFFWKNPANDTPIRRLRNPIKIVDEIEYLVNEGYESFYFDDPTFPFRSLPAFYLSFIQELKKRDLKINWAAPTRPDELSKEILGPLYDSGFTYTYFGLESYRKTDLSKLGKSIDIDYCLELLFWCKEIGIHCDVSYQIGMPGDDYASIIRSIQWLEKHNLQKNTFFSISAIWPETRLARKFKITSDDFEPNKDKALFEKKGLFYFKPGNPQIERYFSNCSGTFHFITEETAIRAKYYLIDSGFIKRFELI